MEKFLKIWNSSVSGKLCVGMESARFVASSKGTNLLKDGNNYLYFHYKDKVNNMQARNTGTDAKLWRFYKRNPILFLKSEMITPMGRILLASVSG